MHTLTQVGMGGGCNWLWLGQLQSLFYIISVICSETWLAVFHLAQKPRGVSALLPFITFKGNSKGVLLEEQFTE